MIGRRAYAPDNPILDVADEPQLSAHQALILKRIMQGESYFFTGPAGTGKSVLFRAIVRAFAARSKDQQVVQGVASSPKYELGVTASTGMAAM